MKTHLKQSCRRREGAGFTLVELLVVIGIIAILAGVALGPITNGIKQAKHNAAMQTGRQIGQMCFSFSTDNTANGNSYPSDSTGAAIASDLLNESYASDPSVFVVSGQTNAKVYTMLASPATQALQAANCSWSFTTITPSSTTGGITSSASDLTPLVFFNNGVAPTPLVANFTPNGGGNTAITLAAAAPFGTDGIATFYKGNNAVYIKAVAGSITAGSWISKNDEDTQAYTVAP